MQEKNTTSNNNENIVQEIMGLVSHAMDRAMWAGELILDEDRAHFERRFEEGNDARLAIESKLRELVENKFSVQALEAENAHLKDAAWTAIDALEASQAQPVPQLDLSDAGLTAIYKQANNEVGKARPLTTESIFRAMRAVAALAANMKI